MVETVKRAADPISSKGVDAPTRAETRRAQRRHLIIAAAEAELRESGLSGITLTAVGDRVGLSKGALYYYVDSRDSLLALVLGDALGAIRAEASAEAGTDAAPLDQLRAFARAHVRCSVTRPAGPLIASSVSELSAHEPTAELLREHTRTLSAIVKCGIESGDLRDLHPVVATSAFFGTLNSLSRTYDPNGALELDEIIDVALDLLLTGWRSSGDGAVSAGVGA